ncbi:hypothetical protein [Amycolatopsis sp. CA-230715]|uniref:hypothetical protein n=1 Tax=Amycolatopsis sp. CA-230715 TaxID=2745196 RepID=UPI0020B28C4F|nr:hypothetical protein [Amycolatopsis sp. CA-230715]
MRESVAGAHVIERDLRLLDRLRDLQSSLTQDIPWLVESRCDGVPRADGLRDLGERLADLSAALLARADELDAAALAKLPPDRWIPAVDSTRLAPGLAHRVAEHPLRHGLVYLALCGAACLPFYGKDPDRRIDRHARCGRCVHWSTV